MHFTAASEPLPCPALLSCWLQSGRGRHLVRASKPVRHGPVMALQQGVVAGYPMFVRTAVLEQHQTRYLHNDSLIIR